MNSLRTNIDRLVEMSVQGKVSAPKMGYPYRVSHDGGLRYCRELAVLPIMFRLGIGLWIVLATMLNPGSVLRLTVLVVMKN